VPRPNLPIAAIGTAIHNGWVILVTVAVRDRRPVVIDRRRVELVPPGTPSQPYHHEGLYLPFTEADAIVRRVLASVRDHTRAALAAHLERVARVAGVCAITLPEPRAVPLDLAGVLAAGRVVYVADRHLYEVALAEAAVALGLDVILHARKGEFAFAASATRLPEDAVRACTSGVRAALGAPWQQEHQAAMAAAIGALVSRAQLTINAA
jgi:hypothetical protein